MSLQDRLKPFLKVLKVSSMCGGGIMFVSYFINNTMKSVNKIVNSNVMDVEKKHVPEYIYIDDPLYSRAMKIEQDREARQSIGLARIWKSLRHSLAWRLLWLCRHGSRDQRNIALEQLAAFKNSKHWDCLKLAQALDKNTAVLLARTKGADLRYFLPPPIHVRREALTKELISYKLFDLISAVQAVHPHSCIQHFLSKYLTNVQEQAMEADSIPAKPDSITEHDLCILCLDALHHHINLFNQKNYEEDVSSMTLIKMGILPRLAELLLRNKEDSEIDYAVLRILTVLSLHTNLLQDFFQNGLIKDLARLIKSKDVRLSSSAAVCLANLSGEYCYRPGLFLLHPIYRTLTPHTCDTLLVHGLRGGVFVTWRQRDNKFAEPLGIMEVTISDVDCDKCTDKRVEKYLDPELTQVIEDLNELEDESLLADLEVVLQDLPIDSKRDNGTEFMAKHKRKALQNEEQDRCSYTFCWPKDWLSKDCHNIRILGVNYWSSLSEWLERCPAQSSDIATRAADLGHNLQEAGVGRRETPVVWLAHSMGGLIVKQILNEAAQSEDSFKKLCEHTKAILFFSTPHKGSALATMPRPAAAVLWPSNDVRQLKENSPTLLDMHSKFLKFADQYDWETISFAETVPTLVTAFKVPIHFVEAHSADLGRGVFYQLPLDHLSICKPATRQSILYTTVLDVIQRATANNVSLRYSNPFVDWIMSIFASVFKSNELQGKVDENQVSDGLRWFEQVLLDTFTDF